MVAPKLGEGDGSKGILPDVRDPWRIEPLPADLISSPLDFIFAEHLRHREAAQIMALIADREDESRTDRRDIYAKLLHFLQSDLAQHSIDEEEAFFPLLLEKCQPQDGIETLVTRLLGEHDVDRAREKEIVPALARGAQSGMLESVTRRRLRAFSEHLRQHIALENAVLLPIARARLDRAALLLLEDRLRALRAKPSSRPH